MKKTILIVGGRGHYGRPVAEQLQKDGYTVRIFSRDIERARINMGDTFEYFQGDVREPDHLIRASHGCYGFHINLNSTTRRELKEIEYRGTLNCVRAAKSNNLTRISLISSAGVKKENSWSLPVRYKLKTEELVKNSGVPFTIFAPTYFMNGLIAYIKGDRAMIIGKHKRKIKWLAAKDYAHLVSRAYGSQKAVNKRFLIYGPGACTLEEALTIYCKKKYPNLSLMKISPGSFMFMATLSFNRKLIYVGELMKAISRIDDSGDMSETAMILGKPFTTLEDWVSSL